MLYKRNSGTTEVMAATYVVFYSVNNALLFKKKNLNALITFMVIHTVYRTVFPVATTVGRVEYLLAWCECMSSTGAVLLSEFLSKTAKYVFGRTKHLNFYLISPKSKNLLSLI